MREGQKLLPGATPRPRHSVTGSAGPNFRLEPRLAALAISLDAATALLEFGTFGASFAFSLFVAMSLFPIGVLLQRYGATKQSWPEALAVGAGVSLLVAIPTPFFSVVTGSWALSSYRAMRAHMRRDVGDVASDE